MLTIYYIGHDKTKQFESKMKETAFKITQEVYHITPESPKGHVVDISYSYLNKRHLYRVAFSHEQSDWYEEHELTTEKRF